MLSRIAVALTLLTTLLAAAAPPAHAQQLFTGWWVIVGTFPTEPWTRMRTDYQRTNAAARRCGARVFNDFSGKFRGFQPGFNVFVVGAYASRPEADRVAARIRRCFPRAYVKYGEHLGE